MYEELLNITAGILRAWQKLIKIPLPQKWMKFAAGNGKYDEAAGFILAGWLCGALIALIAGAGQMLFNRLTGAFIFALAAWLFMLFHDHGRGDGLIAAHLSRLLPGEVIPFNIVIPVFMMILKFALLMTLFYNGNALFFALVMAGTFAFEVLLITGADFSPPIVNFSDRARKRFLYAAVLVLLISFWQAKLAVAFGALLFAVFWKFAGERSAEHGVTADDIRCCGAAMSWILLLAGMLAI